MMKMKTRYILTFLSLGCVASVAQAADLRVAPGGLEAMLTDEVKAEKALTLSGQMDLRDFTALTENMPGLKSLDLSGVSVTAYDSPRASAVGPSSNKADELPRGALLGLHLTDLALPSGLRVIGEGALAGGEFTTLVLPASLISIGDHALYGCTRLESITFPASVTSAGTYSLAGCSSLRVADLSATGLTEIPARMFEGDAALATVSLPASLDKIGEGSFAGAATLKSVSLPATLTFIGKNAFNASGLENVTLPSSVNEVGDFAFSNCHGLTGAVLENPKATLGRGVFYSDPLFVTLDATGIERFPDYLFAGSHSAEVDRLLADVDEIGAYAMSGNRAETLVFGSTLVYLGDGAMENMNSLIYIDASALESAVPALGDNVFSGIDQGNVGLMVADNAAAPWQAADQWKEFKVFEVSHTGSESVMAVPSNMVKGHFEGTVLRLTSGEPMALVEVYEPGGAKVAEAAPRSTEAHLETSDFAGRVYVVRAILENGHVATLKLMR